MHIAEPPSRTRYTGRLLGLALVLAGLILGWQSVATAQESAASTVYIVEISGPIDLGLAPFLERVLEEADDEPAVDAVILDIDTPGGRLDAVLQMRQALLDADTRTIAFVNREAFSAGALIAIAANEIYMTPGAVMGAATPVEGTGETASEKVVSAVRSTFAATAEERGRNPVVAEAMVDPSVEIEGLIESGRLLTLTTEEALEWGYADGVAENRSELLAEVGLSGASVEEKSPSLAERFVRILTDPIIASLLFSFGALLIFADVLTGGIGVLAAAGVAMLALFYWGHFLAGLAGWEGVVLIVAGIALLAIEVFVIPGLGLAGILGVVSLLGGLYLSVSGGEITTDADVRRAVTSVTVALIAIAVGGIALLALLPQAVRFRGLVLQTQLGQSDVQQERRGFFRWFGWGGDTEPAARTEPEERREPEQETLLGATGVTLSDLRPGGIAEIDGKRVDVVSEGDYLLAGTQIVVVQDEGYRRVVRKLTTET